jgi:hypothetical protein
MEVHPVEILTSVSTSLDLLVKVIAVVGFCVQVCVWLRGQKAPPAAGKAPAQPKHGGQGGSAARRQAPATRPAGTVVPVNKARPPRTAPVDKGKVIRASQPDKGR